MRTVFQEDALEPDGRGVCLAIGFFDGVHLGHQQIIRQCIADASRFAVSSLIVTFEDHPAVTIQPDRAPLLIDTREQRLQHIAQCAPDLLYLMRFDRALMETPAEQFLDHLLQRWGPIRAIRVGDDFVFGRGREGNVAYLERWGEACNVRVQGMKSVCLAGEPVRSTRVRRAIQDGDLDLANQLLGRSWTLTAPIVRGRQLGRQLGFPTANLDTRGRVLPPNGVYAVRVQVAHRSLPAVANIGFRPTVEGTTSSSPQVEVHVLQPIPDCYGEQMEVRFVEHLRAEKKFDSLEALRAAIEADVRHAERILT